MNLFVISGPSGAGKTSLVSALSRFDNTLVRPVTHTTRQPRPGERDGVDYHFRTKAQFMEMVAAGGFVEHAEVHGNMYGTSKASIDCVGPRQSIVLIVDCVGAESVRGMYPACTTIFVTAPSDALRTRLAERAQVDPGEVNRRLINAEKEMARAHEFDRVITNIDFETALLELRQIVCCRQGTGGADATA